MTIRVFNSIGRVTALNRKDVGSNPTAPTRYEEVQAGPVDLGFLLPTFKETLIR